MIPSAASLLAELYPNKGVREWLPMLTMMYMAPGGHRQWPMSISALLDRLSWLVMQTRALALSIFQTAVQKNPKWQPRYRCGPKVAVAPSTPFKFLDIGTKMGCYSIGDHIPASKETTNILHPRFVGLPEFHLPTPFMPQSIRGHQSGPRMVKCGAFRKRGLRFHQTSIFVSQTHQDTSGVYQ